MGCLLTTTRVLWDLEQFFAASCFLQNSCNVLAQYAGNSQIPASDPSRQLTWARDIAGKDIARVIGFAWRSSMALSWEIALRFMAYSTEYPEKDAHSECRRGGRRCR